MALVTAATMLVPVIGLATAPILAQSLGVAGRGGASAALAPNLLIVGGATLGLPSALTYVLARRPALTRRALGWATLFALALGGVVLVGVRLFRDVLAAGDPVLAELIVLATWWALPTLVVGLLRGAAYGRQLWTIVAIERVTVSLLRLALLAGLALTDSLDVRSAVIVMSVVPAAAGLVYLGLLLRRPPPDPGDTSEHESEGSLARRLAVYGTQEWLGSVAVMLMARMSQLLVTPLSGVEQLGLLIAAITVSDVPYLVTQAVREVAFGATSAESDTERLLRTSRVATLVAVAGSAIIGATLPWWITAFFGAGFEGAVPATWVLLVSSCVAVPGLLAGAGLDAAGRPALRSLALAAALVVNVVGLVVLVPLWGALGAAVAALGSTLLATIIVVRSSRRLLETEGRRYVVPERGDLDVARSAASALTARLAGRTRRE